MPAKEIFFSASFPQNAQESITVSPLPFKFNSVKESQSSKAYDPIDVRFSPVNTIFVNFRLQ